MLNGIWGGTGRAQALEPPFTSMKMLRKACLDLIGSVGSAEAEMIKRLVSLSSLENVYTTFHWSYLSQTTYCVGGRF